MDWKRDSTGLHLGARCDQYRVWFLQPWPRWLCPGTTWPYRGFDRQHKSRKAVVHTGALMN